MYLKQAETGYKERMDAGWLFYHGESTMEEIQSMTEASMAPVTLPHDWSITFPFDEHADTLGAGGYVKAGVGWYKTWFAVDAGAEDEDVILQFDGVYMNSKVWLNGHLLGGHVYGYTPFSFSVREWLYPGAENELIVFVDNSAQPNSRWYSGSGITRPVWIYRENRVHISGESVFVRTERADFAGKMADVVISGAVVLPGTVGKNAKERGELTLAWTLSDPAGEACAEGTLAPGDRAAGFQICAALENVRFWDTEHPVLYELTLSLMKAGVLLDQKTWRIGVRTAEFDAKRGFLLNGKQVKLNGVCLHHDGGCVGAAVPLKIWERRLIKLKDMGCNSIRFSHNPPDPGLLTLCDTMGFLVMDEAFDEWKITKRKEWGSNTHESLGYSKWFDECGEADLRAMLLRDRNHPCIVLWSIGNEVPEQLAEDGDQLAARLKEIVRSLDPTRKITQANDQISAEPEAAREDFLNTLDVVGYNYVDRWRERAELLYDVDRVKHPDWCVIGSENPSAGYVRNDTGSGGSIWSSPYYVTPVRVGHVLRYTMTHEFVAGDYMWTGIDYLGEAAWPGRSQSCGVLDTCGYEKDGYYFYRSIWNRTDPMVYLCPHWNLSCEPEKIVPVIGYTNCHSAELFLNGKSYGRKSYLYPAYGMTERFAHWDDRKEFPNTDDLFLSWDVPYIPGTITIVGYDKDGNETARMERRTAKAPARLLAKAWESTVKLSPDEVIQLEIFVVDEDGTEVPDACVPVHLAITGPAELLGMDNGRADCHLLFGSSDYETFAGRAFAVLRPTGAGTVTITVESEGAAPGSVRVTVESEGLHRDTSG